MPTAPLGNDIDVDQDGRLTPWSLGALLTVQPISPRLCSGAVQHPPCLGPLAT